MFSRLSLSTLHGLYAEQQRPHSCIFVDQTDAKGAVLENPQCSNVCLWRTFLAKNAPWRDGDFGPLLQVVDSDPIIHKIAVSERGTFFEKKCAIDRRLSTEGSPKLRLWRLFDPQNIHECARCRGKCACVPPGSRAHSCIFCGSNRRQRRSFEEPSVLKCLSMAHFFSEKIPMAGWRISHTIGYSLTHLENGSNTRFRQGGLFSEKSAP